MPVIKGCVIEKWSEKRIPNIEVEINDLLKVETDEEGCFNVESTVGKMKIYINTPNYEPYVQSLDVIANATLNIVITPVLQAL